MSSVERSGLILSGAFDPVLKDGVWRRRSIKVEGDKGKEVIVHYGIVPRNEKHGIMTIFHGNGTRLISPRKEIQKKENDYEYLCRKLIL